MHKYIYTFLFLPIICCIGIVTSYQDFKTSKIRNKWVLAGLTYAVSVYGCAWILYALTRQNQGYEGILISMKYVLFHFDKWCVNLILSSLVAYGMWHVKVWAAGDAKLFICYAALIPMGQYSFVYWHYYFAAFGLLLAIFFPATVFYTIKAFVYTLKTQSHSQLKQKIGNYFTQILTIRKIFTGINVVCGFAVVFLFLFLLRAQLQQWLQMILPNQNFIMLIVFLFFRKIAAFFRKHLMITLVSCGLILLYNYFFKIFLWHDFIGLIQNSLLRAALLVIIFKAVNYLVMFYTENITKKTTPFAQWLFLGALIIWFL